MDSFLYYNYADGESRHEKGDRKKVSAALAPALVKMENLSKAVPALIGSKKLVRVLSKLNLAS